MSNLLVVGGGLAGPVLAVYLARRGHVVDVFERALDPRGGERKNRHALNITLCERGLRALAAVGMKDRVLALAVPVYGRRIHNVDGSVGFQPYGNGGEAIHCIERSELNDALIACAEKETGVRLHFGQRCVGLDLVQPRAHFEDVRTGGVGEARCERVFGADGAHSIVRQQMQMVGEATFSRQYWTHGYSSLTIPARSDGGPGLEKGALHVWPRGDRMLIAFPNRDGRFNCSLLLPLQGERSFESIRAEEHVFPLFRALFPDATDLLPNLAEQFFAGPPNRLLTIRCHPWSYEGKALLVGDSAHALLPSYGQGANAAFEDCSVLDQCLAERKDDWAAAFREFERRRKPSTDAMADLCVEHFRELSELVGDPTFLRRREIERRLHELYADLYQPLYSMVTFGSMPYLDAIRIERRQRKLIDRMLHLGIDGDLESMDARRLLEEDANGQE